MEYKNVQVLDNITVENDNENDNENADNNGPFTALGYIEPEHKAQSAIQGWHIKHYRGFGVSN